MCMLNPETAYPNSSNKFSEIIVCVLQNEIYREIIRHKYKESPHKKHSFSIIDRPV